jgi:cyclic pyranopterin phosphate synthase
LLQAKFKIRGGIDTLEKLEDPRLHSQNRNIIAIDG